MDFDFGNTQSFDSYMNLIRGEVVLLASCTKRCADPVPTGNLKILATDDRDLHIVTYRFREDDCVAAIIRRDGRGILTPYIHGISGVSSMEALNNLLCAVEWTIWHRFHDFLW